MTESEIIHLTLNPTFNNKVWLDYVVYSQLEMRLFDLVAEQTQRYTLCFHRKLQSANKKVRQRQIYNNEFATKTSFKLNLI